MIDYFSKPIRALLKIVFNPLHKTDWQASLDLNDGCFGYLHLLHTLVLKESIRMNR